MSRFLPAFCLMSALAVSAPALASPITFTQTSLASGSIGLISFQNATVTITQVTDTSLTTFDSNLGYVNAGGLRTVTISGVGTGSFLSSTTGFSDSPSGSLLVFRDPSQGFFFGGTNSAFATYNLAGAIGPITEANPGGFSFEDFTNTSLGDLYYTASTAPTFQATLGAAPAPEIDPSLAGSGWFWLLVGLRFYVDDRGAGRFSRAFGATTGCSRSSGFRLRGSLKEQARRSRFPTGMTTRKAKARTAAGARRVGRRG